MILTRNNIELTDLTINELDSNQLYFGVPLAFLTETFKETNTEITDPDGNPNDNFTAAELQVIFPKDSEEIEEILLFPVFEDEDGYANGENFVSVSVDADLENFFIETLRRAVNGTLTFE